LHNEPYYQNKTKKTFQGLGDGDNFKVVQINKGPQLVLFVL
jgi:hypothetical protein